MWLIQFSTKVSVLVMAGLVSAIPVDARHNAGHDAHVKIFPLARLIDFAHSPASIFLPAAGCTRVIWNRPSAQTTVRPSPSTATTAPSLPAFPFGSLAGSGLASKIFTVFPSSVVQAPGAGLQPRIRRSICSHGLPQSILALPGPQRPS